MINSIFYFKYKKTDYVYNCAIVQSNGLSYFSDKNIPKLYLQIIKIDLNLKIIDHSYFQIVKKINWGAGCHFFENTGERFHRDYLDLDVEDLQSTNPKLD